MTLLVIHFLQIARISMTSIDIVATIYGLILYSPQSFIQADSTICECIQINSRLMECRKPKHLTPFSPVRTDTIAENEKLKTIVFKTICDPVRHYDGRGRGPGPGLHKFWGAQQPQAIFHSQAAIRSGSHGTANSLRPGLAAGRPLSCFVLATPSLHLQLPFFWRRVSRRQFTFNTCSARECVCVCIYVCIRCNCIAFLGDKTRMETSEKALKQQLTTKTKV